jgi:hypothetical protein
MATSTKIYLRAIRDGDRFKVVDQDGREVAHLRGLAVDVVSDDVIQITVKCLDHNAVNQPHTARG